MPAAPRRHVPKRRVDRSDGKADGSTAAHEMQGPPHLLPQPLDPVGGLADQQGRQLALDEAVDRGSATADGVGVSETLCPIRVSEPHRDSSKAVMSPCVESDSVTGNGTR